MPQALFWNYRYRSTVGFPEWHEPIAWISRALRECDWELRKHPDCAFGFNCPVSNDLTQADLVLYTHTTAGQVRGFNGPQWFMKSTGPDQFHMTLDPLGFGPYSSIAYQKPPFDDLARIEDQEVNEYFSTKVPGWIEKKTSKWGDGVFDPVILPNDDFVLVLGQVFNDEVVDGMWFGDYWKALFSVVQVLSQVETNVVVKLHPWTDGTGGFGPDGKPLPQEKTEMADHATMMLQALGPNVRVYSGMGSIHDFLDKCKCVVLCNSSAGIDAMLHRKPIISWGFPEYHWITYDLRHLCDLPRALNLDWYSSWAQDRFIYWYTERYCVYDFPSAKRRVQELLGQTPRIQRSFSHEIAFPTGGHK